MGRKARKVTQKEKEDDNKGEEHRQDENSQKETPKKGNKRKIANSPRLPRSRSASPWSTSAGKSKHRRVICNSGRNNVLMTSSDANNNATRVVIANQHTMGANKISVKDVEEFQRQDNIQVEVTPSDDDLDDDQVDDDSMSDDFFDPEQNVTDVVDSEVNFRVIPSRHLQPVAALEVTEKQIEESPAFQKMIDKIVERKLNGALKEWQPVNAGAENVTTTPNGEKGKGSKLISMVKITI